MTQSHFDVIAERVGAPTARDVVDALRKTGYIIVRHDAIQLAQAHARAEMRDEIVA